MYNLFEMEYVVIILIVLTIYISLSLIGARVVKFHWLLRYLFGFTILPLFFFLMFMNYRVLELAFPDNFDFFNRIRSISQPFIVCTIPALLCYFYYLALVYLNKLLPQK
jgi:hypothetical protein